MQGANNQPGAPTPWFIVAKMYEFRTGQRMDPEEARSIHRLAMDKLRAAIGEQIRRTRKSRARQRASIP